MEIKAYATRQGGQWKIRLHAPEWVINDILRDADLQTNSVITISSSDPYFSRPGPSVLSSVRFEEEVIKKLEEPVEDGT